MKGYATPYGYRGYINGQYKLFATEQEYVEYYSEMETETK